jgi:hypothetical protein
MKTLHALALGFSFGLPAASLGGCALGAAASDLDPDAPPPASTASAAQGLESSAETSGPRSRPSPPEGCDPDADCSLDNRCPIRGGRPLKCYGPLTSAFWCCWKDPY